MKSDRKTRILRGGSWYYNPIYCRPSYRIWIGTITGDPHDGFRTVRIPRP